MELAISELKNNPERFLNDFDQIKKIFEGADAEEKVEEWLDEPPCHLYVFYNTVIHVVWTANSQRYTAAPGGLLERNRRDQKISPRCESL